MYKRQAIESAINVKTFKEVKHMGGAAAYVIAEDNWFNGKRFQQQAFQVYEIWKGINQSPSFLSFRDSNNEGTTGLNLIAEDTIDTKNPIVKVFLDLLE